MANAAQYSKAANPEPFRVLGVRLKPLTLNHFLLMSRPEIDVAFVAEDERDATLADLVCGVLICSRHWTGDEFDEFIDSGSYEKELAEWGEKIGVLTTEEMTERATLFRDYIAAGTKSPPHLPLKTSGAASGAHWTQCLINALTTKLGYNREQALHAPLTQVLCDYFFYAESQGSIRLISGEMAEAIANGGLKFREMTREELLNVNT